MKNQKGQVAIITLFAISVFVVIGSSIITQVIFEQRKATLEQKSKEAYFAAESGIENALESILSGQSLNASIEVGDAQVALSQVVEGSAPNFQVPTPMFAGEHFYLNLEGYTGSALRVCWNAPAASVIAAYFYTNTVSGNYLSEYYAFNSNGSSNLTGGTASQPATANVCGMSGNNYYTDITLPASDTPDYLVIWAAYADSLNVGFAALAPATNLPAQGTTITSSAQVVEGEQTVNRQVKYFVSRVAGSNVSYPPNFLLAPVYAVGGVTY